MLKKYVPTRGDIAWLTFSPHAGHEQADRRPAVAISPREYNDKVGLALFCPITSQIKGYPFEVALPRDCGATGVILADQIKSLDFRARNSEFIFHLPDDIIDELMAKVRVLLE